MGKNRGNYMITTIYPYDSSARRIERVASCDVTRRRVDGEMSTAVDARASGDGVGSATRGRRVRCETRGDAETSFVCASPGRDNLSMFSRRIVRGSMTTRTEERARERGDGG
jgi:hypothetical protein